MKNFVAFTFAALLYANSASALVRVVQSCQTENAELNVSILDEQGTGLNRSSHLVALISDKQGNTIVSYHVNPPPAIESVSFGRHPYTDALTQGHNFSLAFPSTNFPHTSLLVKLPSGKLITSDSVVCNQPK